MYTYEVLGAPTVEYDYSGIDPPQHGRPYALVEADTAQAAKWAALKTKEFAKQRDEVYPAHPLTETTATRLPPCLLRCDGGCEHCGG